MNPYSDLPGSNYWRRSVSRVPKHGVDPVVDTKFMLTEGDRVAAAGSCFAQHIARYLKKEGFNFFQVEPGVAGEPVFSARFGNIYTVRQLLQLILEVEERRTAGDIAWKRKDGRYIDALRPGINLEGFDSADRVLEQRSKHVASVRRLFREMDVFVFTLGLTETFVNALDGTVYPTAPGVVAGCYEAARYEFRNFGYNEVVEDLDAIIGELKKLNPGIRILLTVSPVPLIATYENRHVLVSTTLSKAVLRAAVAEVEQKYAFVDYFPSFEIITGNHTRGTYFEDDLRGVNDLGVGHVMRIFKKHYLSADKQEMIYGEPEKLSKYIKVNEKLDEVLCDEESIELSQA